MKTALVTGFDAFDGLEANPSWLAASALAGEVIAGYTVVAAQLPTAFGASRKALLALLAVHKPHLVICVGVAVGRAGLSLERVAINIDDARIPDNLGAQPVDEAIEANGPAGYFSSLPIKAILRALELDGVAAQVSQSAGTFVCNHVFYALMHTLRRQRRPGVRAGFIHVAALPGQVPPDTPSMALEETVRGLRIALACAANVRRDVSYGAGALC